MRSRVLPLLALTAVLTALCVCSAGAQNLNLANQYYQNGEYEKAASLYSQLLERDDQSDLFFNRYVECMINLGQFDECEKAIKKQLKKYPDNISLYVTYGNLFDRQEKTDEAKAQYQRAIDKMSPDYVSVNRLAALFMSNGKYDFATQTYERGSKLLKDPNRFAYNLGELYRRKGDPAKMIEYYLNALSADPGKIYTIQTLLDVNGAVRVKSYTVAGLPSASGEGAGAMIFVSDETGGAVLSFSDGTDWRRVTDRAVVS